MEPEARRVFVVESGDYEMRGIDCIADSPEAAVAHIKGRYDSDKHHYAVEWTYDADQMVLTGTFRQEPGWHVGGVFDFAITDYEVIADL